MERSHPYFMGLIIHVLCSTNVEIYLKLYPEYTGNSSFLSSPKVNRSSNWVMEIKRVFVYSTAGSRKWALHAMSTWVLTVRQSDLLPMPHTHMAGVGHAWVCKSIGYYGNSPRVPNRAPIYTWASAIITGWAFGELLNEPGGPIYGFHSSSLIISGGFPAAFFHTATSDGGGFRSKEFWNVSVLAPPKKIDLYQNATEHHKPCVHAGVFGAIFFSHNLNYQKLKNIFS